MDVFGTQVCLPKQSRSVCGSRVTCLVQVHVFVMYRYMDITVKKGPNFTIGLTVESLPYGPGGQSFDLIFGL